MEQVLELSRIAAGMIETVGGKAVNLGVLTAAGLPVPDGFVVTTQAYRQVTGDVLVDLYDDLTTPGRDLAVVAGQARRRVADADVPDELRSVVLARYAALGRDIPVAVRSSATAEDLADASFAGQQDTYLNVVGGEAVLEAVRHCWASLWTERAVSYRATHGIAPAGVALAVVVQRMVDAQVAGVLFTANPVTGTRRESVVDASPGLGEAVVSGAVNPDHFVVDRDAHRVVQQQLGDKQLVITGRAGGGVERRQVTGQTSPCLTPAQLYALVDLGRTVQDHYGHPQDIEWALDADGRFWLTQTRAITTLYPQVTSSLPGERIFLCMTLAQGLTRPITPAGLAGFRTIAVSVRAAATGLPPGGSDDVPLFRTAGQRAFVDVTGLLGNPLGRRLAAAAFGIMEARTAAVLARLTSGPRFPLTSRSPARVLAPLFRVVILRSHAPLRVLTALASPRQARVAITRIERRLRIRLTLPTGATPEQRLAHVRAFLGTRTFLLMPTVFSYALAGFLTLAVARRLLGDLARPDELSTVLRGLPHNVTTAMDLDLWELAQRVRADPAADAVFRSVAAAELTTRYRRGELPPAAQTGLAAFLRRYGHRAVGEIDLGLPRWSEEPGHLIGMVINYLRLDDPDQAPPAQFRAGAKAATAMVAELTGRVRARHPGRAALVGWLLHRTRELTGLRESPKYLLVLTLASLRAQLRVVGDELVRQGVLEQTADVFFLDLDEMAAGLAGRSMRTSVTERRAGYAVELGRRRIPRILLSDGTEPEALADLVERPDGALAGSPASPGTVSGPARVILDPDGAHLEPGEILVAPSTDPGWTPLFLTAGGLVMEMGGSNSHGAVVAREYGIPAVVGLADATHKIETGQLITVDGAAGLVTLAGPTPAGVS